MSIIKEIHVPDIGDFKGVDIIEVLVAAGDAVEVDSPLILLESDKATLEVPSPLAGTIRELRVKVGDKVSQGDLILYLDVAESVSGPEPPPAAGATGTAEPAASTGEVGEEGEGHGEGYHGNCIHRLHRICLLFVSLLRTLVPNVHGRSSLAGPAERQGQTPPALCGLPADGLIDRR